MEEKTAPKCFRWSGEDYEDFLYSKTENFDFDEYFFTTPVVKGCCLTAQLTKEKGEKPSEDDITAAFATALFEEMKDEDFDSKTAKRYFLSLPIEFYSKATYHTICSKMEKYEEENPLEKDRLEQNLLLFKEYAHLVNDEEIPFAPPSSENHNYTRA